MKKVMNAILLFFGVVMMACSPYKVKDGVLLEVNPKRFYEKIVQIPEGVREISEYAFRNCVSIEEVIFPESLEIIGDCAFLGCENLVKADIPEGVRVIGRHAFWKCEKLEKIIVPSFVEEIGGRAFRNCRGVLYLNCDVEYAEGNDRPFGGACFSSIVIGDKVTKIVDWQFLGMDGRNDRGVLRPGTGSGLKMESVHIPEGVVSIGENAFSYCKLNSLVIPSTVRHIGKEAFYYSGIKHLYFKSTVPPKLGDGALFTYRGNLQEKAVTVHVPKGCKDAYLKAWRNYKDSGVGLAHRPYYFYIQEM